MKKDFVLSLKINTLDGKELRPFMTDVIASKEEKRFERFKDASFFEKNQKEIKTFENAKIQCINHDVIRQITSQRSEFCRNRRKNFRLKKTILIFFNVIFLMKVDFFFFNCELILSNFRKIYIRKYHLRSNEINVKTFHYFSIKNETQDTTLSSKSEKIEHALHYFVQTERAEKQIILIFKCATL